ncbi:hypothetical protein P7L78_21890 [Tistrella bauzanensis]|uniref:hypothetical protein n=1 Tax=Tistrella TaxID=171436 RepID=UPI0031F6DEC4
MDQIVTALGGYAVEVVAGLAVAGMAWLVREAGGWLRRKRILTDLAIDETTRQYLDDALRKAIRYGASAAAAAAVGGKAGRQLAIDEATAYAQRAVPDAMARLGLTPEHVADMIAARVGLTDLPPPDPPA